MQQLKSAHRSFFEPRIGLASRGVRTCSGASESCHPGRVSLPARKRAFDDVNAMLRTMLKERLKLKAHIEPRDMPVYALIVARPGEN